ncbi:hypothetical protein ACFSQP_10855 [Bizionia sediminis]|uniref:Lipoprotein n=1 Tax=Bizionia sediminis TaxID=1737064 RepID=A0ABW5KUR1_9FLAO
MTQYFKSLFFLAASLVLITFSSCDNEPLDNGLLETENQQVACQNAVQATVEAVGNLSNPGDADYEALCNALRQALVNQLEACGDPTGELQETINTLDCQGATNLTCEDATAATALAATAYNAEPNNATLCNAYKLALENEIELCGDPNGTLQNMITSLGSCDAGGGNSAGTLSVTTGTLNIVFTTSSAELNNGRIVVNGSRIGNGANYLIYFELIENETGVDVMQNFKLTVNGGEFFPNMDGFDDFTNTITVNANGIIQGSFGGIVTRNDGADLSLSQGTIDLVY